MSDWDELNDEYQDEWEDDLEREDDPDNCNDCGVCDACIEQSRAYAEDMEMEEALRLDQKKLDQLEVFGTLWAPCDCAEDMTKAYGGHREGCPNRIPF